MARIYPLFSSSKGNSSYIGSPSGGILIDAGVTYKRLDKALKTCGLNINAVQGIFITHSHSDHVKGLKVLTKKTGIPIYGQKKTLTELIQKDLISPESPVIEIDGSQSILNMEITCFNTPHDTAASCGYKINTVDGRTCAVCTDLGHVTTEVKENLKGCDLVLIEANYDENMLRNGIYPDFLKARIGSDHGHLSNNCCSSLAAELIRHGTTRIILGHLSEENNTPYTAEKTVYSGLSNFKRNTDYILQVAPVETDGEMVVF